METSNHSTDISYRPDIDGLRALAILSVVAYHAGLPFVPGGFTGVDVFLVISGCLITQLLLKESASTGTISIAAFYARRARRLLPALAVVLTVTLLAGALFLPESDFREKTSLAKSAMAAVFFASNQYFFGSTGGYFNGPSNLLPLLHLWSLSVEEQFYLVWPLLLILMVKLSPPETRVVRVRILVATICVSSFLISSWLLRVNPSAAFYLLPSRAWELGVGAGLATLPSGKDGPERTALGMAAGLIGILLLAVGFFGFNAATQFPGPAAAVPVLGSALLLYAGMRCRGNPVSRALSARPLVAIGLVSYSWYLWHWPLLSIVRNRRMSESNLPLDCAISLLALACAALSVRFVENPIRYFKGPAITNRLVLATGAASLLFLLGVAGAVGAWAKYGPQSPFQELAHRERPPFIDDCLITRESWDGTIPRKKCAEVPVGRAEGASPLVVVWGDSHAYAWTPAVQILARSDGIETQELTFAACPPLADAKISVGGRALTPCSSYNTGVLERLKDLRKADPRRRIGVVLGARWEGYLGTFSIPMRNRSPEFRMLYAEGADSVAENIQAMKNGLRKTLGTLRDLNMRVLIVLNGPEFRMAPTLCMTFGYGESECDEPTGSIQSSRKAAVDAVWQVAQDVPDVRVLDPLPFFCRGASCPAFMNGHPVDWDDSHISLSSSEAFAPSMRKKFRWLFETD